MATIQKKTSKRHGTVWRVQVRRRGYPPQSATFLRKTDAREWARQIEGQIDKGLPVASREAKLHTVADLIDRYIEDVLPAKRSGKDQARILGWWKQKIGDYTLANVTPALLVEYRDKLARGETNRGKRSPSTVNRYLAYLSHPLTVAVREWQWLDSNPMRRVSKLKEPRGRVRFLSNEERERLLKACRERGDPLLYPLVVLALSTGARQGELLGLRWPDVDLRRRVALIHETKNEERRALPLSGLAYSLVRDLKKLRRLDTDLVFANAKGRALFPRKAWDEALRAAEVDDFRFHDLRHSAASYLAMNGATLAEIAEVLGHKTLAMVKRYSHLTEAHTAGVVARMNEAIFGEAKS
jgi:integrase